MLQPLRFKIETYTFLMIPVEGGAFDMGDEVGDLAEVCRPVHRVQVSSFYLAQVPVAQELWRLVMGKEWDDLKFKGDMRPMERVSWDDILEFLKQLEQKTGYSFRLPTEAEWEFAARGGVYNTQCLYAGSKRLKEVGWFEQNSHDETKVVGRKFSNELGLYDMSGNVWEYCEDDWHGSYDKSPPDGRAWTDQPKRGAFRVRRGGSPGGLRRAAAASLAASTGLRTADTTSSASALPCPCRQLVRPSGPACEQRERGPGAAAASGSEWASAGAAEGGRGRSHQLNPSFVCSSQPFLN